MLQFWKFYVLHFWHFINELSARIAFHWLLPYVFINFCDFHVLLFVHCVVESSFIVIRPINAILQFGKLQEPPQAVGVGTRRKLPFLYRLGAGGNYGQFFVCCPSSRPSWNWHVQCLSCIFAVKKLFKSKTLDLIVPLKSTITTEYLDAHVVGW